MPVTDLTVLSDIRRVAEAEEKLLAEAIKANVTFATIANDIHSMAENINQLVQSTIPKIVGIEVSPGTPTTHK